MLSQIINTDLDIIVRYGSVKLRYQITGPNERNTGANETTWFSGIIVLRFYFSDMPNGDNPMVAQLRTLASSVLFALSQNNFNAVFNKISAR